MLALTRYVNGPEGRGPEINWMAAFWVIREEMHLGTVTVYMQKLQKQERGFNNCAFFCAAYMTDVVSYQTDWIPEAIYVDGKEQRKVVLQLSSTSNFCVVSAN